MYPRKKTLIIISTLSVLLITSIILLILVSKESNQKSNDLKWLSEDYQNKIDELEEDVVQYAEQYYLIKNELDQRNKISTKYKLPVFSLEENLPYRTLYDLDLKTEMTPNCAVITTIPAGAKVNVEESFFGTIWKVSYKGKKGWVDANGTLEKI
jgi:hypothetical protein